jgi:hypothetical protein
MAGETDKPWLIVFVTDIISDNPYSRFGPMNKLIEELLMDFTKTDEAKQVNTVFVDISSEDGELLKETFDVTKIPDIRLVKGDRAYLLKWGSNGLWSKAELTQFVNGGYESALYDFKRKLVQEGFEMYLEYAVNTISTDNSFNHAMENYLTIRKLIHDWTGYKHDLK